MKINANLIKVGNVLNHKDRMMEVLNTSVIKPGKGGAYIQVEMKDMKTGTKFNERWRTSDSVEKVSVNEIDVIFLYIENDSFTVMNNQTFEQMTFPFKLIAGKEKLLEDGMNITLEMVDDKISTVKFPKNIKVEIKTADAVVKGQTASSSYKPAKLKNGLNIMVPPFIEEGNKIMLDTRNLEYVKKVN